MRFLATIVLGAALASSDIASAEGPEKKPAPAAAREAKPEQKPEQKPETRGESPAPAPVMSPKGPARIDFDDRLLQGQTNRLGSVYLYQRKQPAQASLLERRRTFRDEIRRDLLE